MVYLATPEEDFVEKNEAIELMVRGFEEPCVSKFVTIMGTDVVPYTMYSIYFVQNLAIGDYLRPTYSQAFRWLRRKYNVGYIIETLQNGSGYRCSLIVENPYHFVGIDNRFDTYEDAELNCLKQLLELLKTDYKSKFYDNENNDNQ